MDPKTKIKNTKRAESHTVSHHCTTCNMNFATIAMLRRHNQSRHTEITTKYQCWGCSNTHIRKENVLKHSIKVHRDHEGKFIIVTTKNTRYRPDIFAPKPWTPPQEARPRKGTIYTITIPSSSNFNESQRPPSTTSQPECIWTPLTLTEIDSTFKDYFKPANDINLLEDDIYLSSSDSSISSTETVCLDENPQL